MQSYPKLLLPKKAGTSHTSSKGRNDTAKPQTSVAYGQWPQDRTVSRQEAALGDAPLSRENDTCTCASTFSSIFLPWAESGAAAHARGPHAAPSLAGPRAPWCDGGSRQGGRRRRPPRGGGGGRGRAQAAGLLCSHPSEPPSRLSGRLRNRGLRSGRGRGDSWGRTRRTGEAGCGVRAGETAEGACPARRPRKPGAGAGARAGPLCPRRSHWCRGPARPRRPPARSLRARLHLGLSPNNPRPRLGCPRTSGTQE